MDSTRFESAIKILKALESDRDIYESEEGQNIIRLSVAEILGAIEERVQPYRESLGIRLVRDDKEADLKISGPLRTAAYVHFHFEFLQSNADDKPQLLTFVSIDRYTHSLDGLRETLPHSVKPKTADFQENFTPVFLDEKTVSWSDGRHVHQDAEIVDLVVDQYLKAIESAVQAEASHRTFGFLFPAQS